MSNSVVVPREPTEAMIEAGALAAMEAATEFMEDDFWKDRHLEAIERMRGGDWGSDEDRAKGLKVGAALFRAVCAAAPQPADLRERVDSAASLLRRVLDGKERRVDDGSTVMVDHPPEEVERLIEAALALLQPSPVEQKDG